MEWHENITQWGCQMEWHKSITQWGCQANGHPSHSHEICVVATERAHSSHLSHKSGRQSKQPSLRLDVLRNQLAAGAAPGWHQFLAVYLFGPPTYTVQYVNIKQKAVIAKRRFG